MTRYNASHCRDETAHKAISKITQEDREVDKRAYDIIKLAKQLLEFGGFDILNRIAIKDKETGREYR